MLVSVHALRIALAFLLALGHLRAGRRFTVRHRTGEGRFV